MQEDKKRTILAKMFYFIIFTIPLGSSDDLPTSKNVGGDSLISTFILGRDEYASDPSKEDPFSLLAGFQIPHDKSLFVTLVN